MKFVIFLIILFSIMNNFAQSNRKAFLNGKIFTVNDKQPLAEAVIIENNKIIFTGSRLEADKLITGTTEIIDLKGRLMLPGFIDSHLHLTSGGFYLLGIDLRPAKSTSEFRKILKEYAEKYPGKWITGGNWDHEAWEKKELPVKEMIDDLTPNTPVFVDRLDGHMGLANSYALKLAGITKDTKSPDGGLIVKDKTTGEPTGILKDNAMDLINKILPVPSNKEYDQALQTALDHLKQNGITSVHDITKKLDLETYRRMENKLTCRIYSIYPIDEYKDVIAQGITAGSGNDILRSGSLKGYADGSLGSATAWFFDKYVQDTTTYGLPNDIVSDGRLMEWSLDADKNKLQISIHAIGDKANYFVLDMYAQIKKENPAWDRRFRIEHSQHVRFEDIPKFSQAGVIASVQPYHCIDDGVWAEKRIGKERIKYTHPYKSFLENSVTVCFGTDWPIAPVNPLLGIYGAVTRRTVDEKNPNGWIPEQKITVEDAIRSYTIKGAYASFQERIKGSIEVGKLADLVVLSEDILSVDPVKIKDVKVDMTVFDGEVVFVRVE